MCQSHQGKHIYIFFLRFQNDILFIVIGACLCIDDISQNRPKRKSIATRCCPPLDAYCNLVIDQKFYWLDSEHYIILNWRSTKTRFLTGRSLFFHRGKQSTTGTLQEVQPLPVMHSYTLAASRRRMPSRTNLECTISATSSASAIGTAAALKFAESPRTLTGCRPSWYGHFPLQHRKTDSSAFKKLFYFRGIAHY